MLKQFTLTFALLLAGFLATPAHADSKAEIDANVQATMSQFKAEVPGANEILSKAQGYLVFPKVFKGGFVVAGEYGEGALRENGRTTGYYSTAAGSLGFQIGAEVKSILIFFMTDNSLKNFKTSEGWKVGADATVTLITVGANGEIDSETLKKPIIAFVIGQKGLMAGISLEGAKVTRLEK